MSKPKNPFEAAAPTEVEELNVKLSETATKIINETTELTFEELIDLASAKAKHDATKKLLELGKQGHDIMMNMDEAGFASFVQDHLVKHIELKLKAAKIYK